MRVAPLALAALLVFTFPSHERPAGAAGARRAESGPSTAVTGSDPHALRAARARARVDAAFRRVQHGLASYYAHYFDGRLTASGIPFDNRRMFAAHPTYPFGTRLRVTNLHNGRWVDVRVVDRGPADGPQADGVVIDLSRAAAEALAFVEEGRVQVRLDRIGSGTTRAAARRMAAAEGH